MTPPTPPLPLQALGIPSGLRSAVVARCGDGALLVVGSERADAFDERMEAWITQAAPLLEISPAAKSV